MWPKTKLKQPCSLQCSALQQSNAIAKAHVHSLTVIGLGPKQAVRLQGAGHISNTFSTIIMGCCFVLLFVWQHLLPSVHLTYGCCSYSLSKKKTYFKMQCKHFRSGINHTNTYNCVHSYNISYDAFWFILNLIVVRNALIDRSEILLHKKLWLIFDDFTNIFKNIETWIERNVWFLKSFWGRV